MVDIRDEMPVPGKKRKLENGKVEETETNEDFDDENDEAFQDFLKLQIEEQKQNRMVEKIEKKHQFIRLMRMWVKILDHYSLNLNKNEIQRIQIGLYFDRCEEMTVKQLIRLENRAITIIEKTCTGPSTRCKKR